MTSFANLIPYSHFPSNPRARLSAVLLLSFLIAIMAGCSKQDAPDSVEHAYVAAPQLDEVALRDRVAAVYTKVAVVKNGDRVRVLDRSGNKRFVRVRTEDAKEGWIEQRYLIGQDIFDQFKKLAQENANVPTQATAVIPRPLNLRVQPSRNSETLYQLKEGTTVELLKRTSTPKSGMVEPALGAQDETRSESDRSSGGDSGSRQTREEPVIPKSSAKLQAKVMPAQESTLEDWWLARDPQKRVGWLRGRTVDIEVPLEIAQYAEGQRIVGSFVLNTVDDQEGHKILQYAVLMTEPKDGLPFDFNQLRVFTWNKKRNRYETAFRDRFDGELPFTVGKGDFGKEGVLPIFTARFRDAEGKIEERKYKMNGVIVRRITSPGEILAPPKLRKAKKRT